MFAIFLSGEVTAVWICISGEGKGVSEWTKQPFRATQQLADQLSPSICSHRAFLSGILDSSSGCLFERTACRSISQQQDKPHAHGSGKLFQTDNPGISVQLAARWAGTAWHFCICQGGRREARASGTRSDKPNHPPAS